MTAHALHRTAALGLAAFITGSSFAAAQTAAPAGGWTVTPSFLVNSSWDNNALLLGEVGQTPADFVNVLNPRLEALFRGRRGEFAGSYDGAFRLYRSFGDLNSFDQYSTVSARRLVTRHVTLFASNQLSKAPTTEVTEIVGIPFARTGTTSEYLRGGVDAALTKRSSLVGAYTFQIVRFEENEVLGTPLKGGHSHGGSFTFRRAISDRVSLTADYNLQHAIFGELEVFDVHRGEGGAEYRASENLRLFGALGVARLRVSTPGLSRTGPSWRAGVARTIEPGSVEATYSRSFVPAYGFGGTQQNEELTGRLRLSLSPVLYTMSSMSWRRNEPLIEGLRLRTISVHASVGYMFAPWVGLEGFYDTSHQKIDRPGGVIDRQRLGVQVVTTTSMRIR